MLLQLLGPTPLTFLINASSEVDTKMHQDPLEKVRSSSIIESALNRWHMLLKVLGTVLLRVWIKSLLEEMENVSNASSLIRMGYAYGGPCANYFTFLYRILIKSAFVMFLSFLGQIPLHFFVSSPSSPVGYAAHVSCDNSFKRHH